MIHGIGVDMVRIARIERALEHFGVRFAERILAPQELDRFAGARRKSDFLAKQFAAKEALVKALGTGIRLGVTWHDAEVRRDALGKPYFVCRGRLQALLDELGVGEAFVSITDEDDYAVAFVTLVRR